MSILGAVLTGLASVVVMFAVLGLLMFAAG